ncbi:hypothetical protein FITA111629_13690 [Filibacter tadaridae]|uniref:Uncharacterized protein n=2 Tax=Filibacter tadaridae TaxID=2483811 RepID=A0A3P5XFY0_9BACL|nr:hypothetical protein [Filibacter tadaridae]VDC33677.1 hypothetical protein FILTAD_02988 [Filibacter tadaridae]
MKKPWKIAIIILIVIILGIAAYLTYILKFKKYDVADAEVTEIIADPYTVELPDGTSITVDENGNIIETNDSGSAADSDEAKTTDDKATDDKTGTSSTDKSSTDNKTDSTSNNNSSTDKQAGTTTSKPGTGSANQANKPTVATIKNTYTPVFNNLESQANGKINALVGRAKQEYSSKKANGESINYGYFYNKYMAAANELEASTDAIFYGTLKVVEAELVNNGYNKSYAQSFKDEYEAMKKTRRDSILSKAVGR